MRNVSKILLYFCSTMQNCETTSVGNFSCAILNGTINPTNNLHHLIWSNTQEEGGGERNL